MSKLFLYFNTLKHLKFSQLFHRMLKIIRHPKIHNVEGIRSPPTGTWITQEIYTQKFFNEADVKFLNHNGSVIHSNDWNNPKEEKLWLYNLHYFDDLASFDSAKRQELQLYWINRWVDDNPAVNGGNGWEAYTLSLRVVNWSKAFLSGLDADKKILNSLAQQADFLSQDLEKHLLGNHYFVNLKALIFAGCFLQGSDANNWLSLALKNYEKELEEQVLADGGNFELTPMYHVIMLVDLLDLLNLFNAFPDRVEKSVIDQTHNCVNDMFQWLNAMKHCDDKISFFNDSAFGIAPEVSTVLGYANQLGINVKGAPGLSVNELISHDLSETGYVSVQTRDFTLIADLSEVGPSYQPGHAHADTLSYEFSLYGNRLFVNSGISEYGLSKERLRQRQTSAHNTVVVDGCDSSQVWSGFRVAKRANIVDKDIEQMNDDVVKFGASHNGFKQQGINCIHRRTWSVRPQIITVVDNLIGEFKSALSYLHLHPDVEVVSCSNNEVELSVAGQLVLLSVTEANVSVENTLWFPEFGVSLSNKKLCFAFTSHKMSLDISWEGR